MDPKKKQQLYWMLLAFAAIVMVQGILGTVDSPERISYSKFLQLVDDGAIKSVEIRETEIHAATKDSKQIITQRLPETDDPGLTELLRERSVEFSGKTVKESWWQTFLIMWIFPLGLIFLVYSMFQKRMGGKGGPLSFGKNRAQVFDRSKENPTTFADVAGVDEAVAELKEVVDFLKHPEKYQELGARIPRGVLLLGPPGTGKTLLARAVAGEADVPFYSMSGSEFVEMFVGVGAARMRSLFAEAKEHTPCIVFLDELDAIGKARGGLGTMATNDEREQTLNQLLIEMDGFEADTGVVVMAATNRPEVLDPALVRAGRFDRQIAVDAPTMQGREAILKIHARKIPLDKSVDLEQYARRTPGMVGADLANVVNEASLAAARRESKTVSPDDFEEAIDRIQLGLKKAGKVMSDEERERVAVHESGHALVAHKLEHADPVYKITIVPRSIGALGATLQLPEEDRQLHTKEELLDQICVMLGGRSAEELVCGSISTGASNDIERATEIARQMVSHYGMSELGLQTFGQTRGMQFLKGAATLGDDRNFSEHTAEEIDRVIHELIETEHERAKSILGANRDELEHLSQTLLAEETIDAVRLVSLLAELSGEEAPKDEALKDEAPKDEKPKQETQTKDESPKKTLTSPESLAPQVDDELPAADDAS